MLGTLHNSQKRDWRKYVKGSCIKKTIPKFREKLGKGGGGTAENWNFTIFVEACHFAVIVLHLFLYYEIHSQGEVIVPQPSK